jgi:antitoxin HicB
MKSDAKQLNLVYPAKITKDKNGYYVNFLDFDAFSEGDTLEEAIFNAQEALDVTLLGLVETDRPIPSPRAIQSKGKHQHIYLISAGPEVTVPVLLYRARKAEHKTISHIAKAMNVSFQRYHDIEQGRNITLKTLKKVAAALGATVEIKFHQYRAA